jgi:hypothetical protein
MAGMRAVGVVSLLVVLGTGGAAEAGSGFFVPPMRLDASAATMARHDGALVGVHLLAGLHWASLWPGRRTPVDVGIGYLYEAYAGGPQSQPEMLAAGGQVRPADPAIELHGAYFEMARRAGGDDWRRTWLGARAELLFSEVNGRTLAGVGFTGRAAWELFAPVKSGGHDGCIVGTFALGVYLELGGRRLPDGTGAVQSTAGLSMRLPLIAIGD